MIGHRAMAATESSGSQERELDETPTWAVSGVCAVIIIISIVLEKVLHRLGTVSFVIFSFNFCCFSCLFANFGSFSFVIPLLLAGK